MSLKSLFVILACGAAFAGCKSAPDTSTTTSTTPESSTPPASPDKPSTPAAGENSLVGSWDAENSTSAPGAKTTFEVKDDGTVIMTGSNKTPDGKGTMTAVVDEKYKEDGKNISFEVVDMKVTCDEPEMQKQLDAAKDKTDELVKSGKANTKGTIEWKDKDNAVLTLNTEGGTAPQTITIKRKAE